MTRNMKPFTTIAAVIFALVACMHILRLSFGWEVTVSGQLFRCGECSGSGDRGRAFGDALA